MKTVLMLSLSLLGSSFLCVADEVLCMPERGELQKNGKEVAFTPIKDSILDQLSGGSDIWIVSGGGVLLSAKLQDAKPHRPTERIIVGGIGNYNIGLLAPCSGIPIFIAVGNQRPKLVGMSDANGHFAVKLPQHDNSSGVFIFFNGDVEVPKIPNSDDQKDIRIPGRNMRNNSQELVLKIGSPTVRFRVSIPEAEQAGAGQPATRPESKSEGVDKPQPESEGRSR